MIEPNEFNSIALLLLVYPTKRKSSEITKIMGRAKMQTYEKVFGNNNTKKGRLDFFQDEFYRMLWN